MRIRKILNCVPILIFLLLQCITSISGSDRICDSNKIRSVKEIVWYEYEPNIVSLKGILYLTKGYGPPNYGENPKEDKVELYYIIKLDNPINIKGDSHSETNKETFKNVVEIQLVIYDTNKYSIKDKIDKRVEIQGTLFQAISGHHYTPVLVNVEDIKKIK